MKSRTHLAEIVVTQTARRVLGGDAGRTTKSKEIWAAETTDGVWHIERIDEPGTPWLITRIADKANAGSAGSLREARADIAAGHAEFTARINAAGRKAHDAVQAAGGNWKACHVAQMAAEHEEWEAIRAERAAKKAAAAA